jgi:hypothetical protein
MIYYFLTLCLALIHIPMLLTRTWLVCALVRSLLQHLHRRGRLQS